MNTKLLYVQSWAELAKQANWSVAKLAQLCGVSARTLERHFLKEVGKRPKKWLAEQRQLTALELLRDGHSVKQTAGYLGYRHAAHFSREFKGHWGYCPTSLGVSNAADAKDCRLYADNVAFR